MKNVLIDSDVLLDFFFDRRPFSDSAAIILSLCDLKRINGFVTPVICSNIYYLLRKNSRHENVIEKIRQLLTFLDVLPMDKGVINEVLNSNFKDFEDALENFSAVKAGNIEVIITRKIKDYSKSQIGIMTPENYIKTIKTRFDC